VRKTLLQGEESVSTLEQFICQVSPIRIGRVDQVHLPLSGLSYDVALIFPCFLNPGKASIKDQFIQIISSGEGPGIMFPFALNHPRGQVFCGSSIQGGVVLVCSYIG